MARKSTVIYDIFDEYLQHIQKLNDFKPIEPTKVYWYETCDAITNRLFRHIKKNEWNYLIIEYNKLNPDKPLIQFTEDFDKWCSNNGFTYKVPVFLINVTTSIDALNDLKMVVAAKYKKDLVLIKTGFIGIDTKG